MDLILQLFYPVLWEVLYLTGLLHKLFQYIGIVPIILQYQLILQVNGVIQFQQLVQMLVPIHIMRIMDKVLIIMLVPQVLLL